MALLQISEPGMSTAPHEHRLAAGIDLGTTHSLIATVRSGEVAVLVDELERPLLPSVVHYSKSQAPTVGYEAKELAARDPLSTIASAKRLMGRGVADVAKLGAQLPYEFAQTESSVPRIITAAGEVSPVEVSAEILKTLKQRAEVSLGGELAGVVITVPAYFDDAQRQATRDAARLAGLNVFRLLNEPTAAAIAYGLDRSAEGIHAVYDLGGGTFDISILRFSRGVFEVMSTAGDTALGGDDIDRIVAEWMMQQARVASDVDHKFLRCLLNTACAAKEALSQFPQVELVFDLPQGGQWCGTLTRATFEQLVAPLVERSLVPCRRAMKDAGIVARDIKDVVMVGGSTRIPLVRSRVAEFFQCQPKVDIDPDQVVAIGAAQQADILAGNKPEGELLLLDVIPLSLGVATMGGLVEKVIPRNSTIPTSRAQEFTTFKDGQTAMEFHVVQGERELVGDCRSLARFELRGIPPMKAGAGRVRVTFQVDADGLLSVAAREETTGVESTIVVKPSYGLSDNEVETMLRDSIEHARADMTARALREQQVNGARALEALRSALAEDGIALLDVNERQAIDAAMRDLDAAITGSDYRVIKERIATLDNLTQSYAARRMNASVARALTGKKIDELNV